MKNIKESVKDMLIEGSQWFSVDQGHIGYYLNEIFEYIFSYNHFLAI